MSYFHKSTCLWEQGCQLCSGRNGEPKMEVCGPEHPTGSTFPAQLDSGMDPPDQ